MVKPVPLGVKILAAALAALAPAVSAQESPEPTAEKEFKNIQVLKGMPASQLMPVMHFMRASLGVRCDFCHVAENGKYDLDTKKNKETARRMIRMVQAINRENFEGRTVVTCNSCHRGQDHPVRVPPIGQGLFADTTRDDAEPAPEKLPDAAEVLDRYIAALGGRAALEAVTRRVSRGTLLRPMVVDSGTPKARAVNRGREDPLEIVQEAPGKLTLTLGPPSRRIVQRFDGVSGTLKTPDGERPLSPQEIARAAALADLRKELALRDRAAKGRVTGKEKIDGRDVILVRSATAEGHPEILAFDAETGLLRRQIVYKPIVLGADPEQTDYEDYRDVGGVKVPFLVKTSFLDDNHLGTTRKLTEVRHDVPGRDDEGAPAPGTVPARIPPAMALTSPYARRFRLLSTLRASLIAGAVYDLGFAVLMVTAPQVTARMFDLPLPGLPRGAFYLWILATLLLMLACLYLAAAHDPRRYSAIIAVAIGGRTLGAAAFLALALRGPDLGGLYPLAAADFAFGAVHAASWLPIRS